MSEIQEQAAVETKQAITEAPASQAQPVAQPQQNPDGFLAQHRIETGSNEWKDGLLDCFHDAPDNLCLKGFCCPCFVYGKTQARLRDPEMKDYERFNTDCLMFVGASYCCGLSWLFPFFRRTDIRTMYDIRGNVLGDCGRAFCCLPCTLIQNDKEVVHRQSLQTTNKAGYQAVPDMNAGQQ